MFLSFQARRSSAKRSFDLAVRCLNVNVVLVSGQVSGKQQWSWTEKLFAFQISLTAEQVFLSFKNVP